MLKKIDDLKFSHSHPGHVHVHKKKEKMNTPCVPCPTLPSRHRSRRTRYFTKKKFTFKLLYFYVKLLRKTFTFPFIFYFQNNFNIFKCN